MRKVVMNTSFLKTFCALLVLLLHSAGSILGFSWPTKSGEVKCIEKERQALLNFKQGIYLDYGKLSTWKGDEDNGDCCKWKGIKCSNQTGHIQMLDLRTSDEHWLTGVINISLLIELQNMEYLDLSYNNFLGSPIPELIGSFSNLTYLNLSDSVFGGRIPYQLGRLTNLRYLDLGSNYYLVGAIPYQLGDLSQLRYLDLGGNSHDGAIPHQLGNLTQLRYLGLGGNSLSGVIPFQTGDLLSLEGLYLNDNKLQGEIPTSFWNICTLQTLDLSGNNFSGELSSSIQNCSCGGRHRLETLNLSKNRITGMFPNFSIFSSLGWLEVYDNRLIGEISHSIELLSELEYLDLNGNSLEGDVTESHFSKLTKLWSLSLSRNSLSVKFGINWVPPFQLTYLELASCKLGPSFPNWLQTQSEIEWIDISSNDISGAVPKWFWHTSQYLSVMNISYNSLSGIIPNLPLKLTGFPIVDFTSNQFEGSIPSFLSGANLLLLSQNRFSNLDSLLCGRSTVEALRILDVSNNQLKGQLPDCWNHVNSLGYLNLSNNMLSGKIPISMGAPVNLKALVLRNNSIIGELPSSMKNLTNLIMLDVGENKLSGQIPLWIGESQQQLAILSLPANHFFGSLPMQLCYLTRIKLLDLSQNCLSEQIPTCLNNLTAMAEMSFNGSETISRSYYEYSITSYDFVWNGFSALLMWKGKEYLFKNSSFLKSIDLSSNNLTGEMPTEIGSLFGLVSLNLSRNNLSGKIILEIGNLKSLDFLDLSRNRFSGTIPSTLAQIDRLSVLDLSNNHLYGKIPTGTQLQSFNASSYEGNLDLCGKPLDKNCLDDETPMTQVSSAIDYEEEDSIFSGAFYMGLGMGFAVGFWGFLGPLLFCHSWRRSYLRFLSKFTDSILVMVTPYMARCHRWLTT